MITTVDAPTAPLIMAGRFLCDEPLDGALLVDIGIEIVEEIIVSVSKLK
jgi:hypothetical protein